MRLEVVSGSREIGGNCIRVVDRDSVFVFDQGIRFSLFRKYFSRFFEPGGSGELREFGVLPPLRVFDNAEGLFISHFHLDHIGLLFDVPQNVKIYVPSLDFIELIRRRYGSSPSWLAYVPPRYDHNIDEAPIMKGDNIIGLLARHSSYPSLAYIYFGSDETILYTGDFRVDRILPEQVDNILYPMTFLEYLEENSDIRINTLIIEGTNIGNVLTYLDGSTVRRLIERIISPKRTALFVTDYGDLELFILILLIIQYQGKEIVISSDRIAQLLDEFYDKIPLELDNVYVLDIATQEAPMLPIIGVSQIIRKPQDYAIITDTMNIAETLRHIGPHIPAGSPAFIMTAEPVDESSLQTEKVMLNWLIKYGFSTYRYRISGHYYPHQLESILRVTKPRKLVPIHTTRPDLLLKMSTKI